MPLTHEEHSRRLFVLEEFTTEGKCPEHLGRCPCRPGHDVKISLGFHMLLFCSPGVKKSQISLSSQVGMKSSGKCVEQSTRTFACLKASSVFSLKVKNRGQSISLSFSATLTHTLKFQDPKGKLIHACQKSRVFSG